MKSIIQMVAAILLFNSCLSAGPVGEEIWSYETDFIIHSSPAIAPDGTIYIGSHDDCMHAVNSDGSGKWKFKTDGDVSSSPAIGEDGTIYFGSKDGCFYAVNPDGTEKWHYQTGAKITGSAAIGSDGTIYIGSRDQFFYAFNPDGSLKWSYDTEGVIYSTPAIAKDGMVYMASDSHQLFAFDADGTLKWSFELERSPYAGSSNLHLVCSPVLGSDGTIFIQSSYSWFYAINPDGSVKWEREFFGIFNHTPSIDREDNIYFTYKKNFGNHVQQRFIYTCACKKDGRLKWEHRKRRYDQGVNPYLVWCSPVIGRDGSIYFFYRKEDYEAIVGFGYKMHDKLLVHVYNSEGIRNHEIKLFEHHHNRQFGYQSGSPVIDENGVLYFGWLDHKLHAVQTESYGMDWGSWRCFGQNLQGTRRDEGVYGPVVPAQEEDLAPDNEMDNPVILSSVEQPVGQPEFFALSQNYPNPFNNQTQIQYQLPRNTHVSLKIFNAVGKEVQTFVNEVQSSGIYQIEWNGTDRFGNQVPSGMYFMELKAGDYREMRKMLLVE